MCHYNQSVCGTMISAYANTQSGSIPDLLLAIYEKGPISVAIDASHKSFSFYSNGVYYEPTCGRYLMVVGAAFFFFFFFFFN